MSFRARFAPLDENCFGEDDADDDEPVVFLPVDGFFRLRIATESTELLDTDETAASESGLAAECNRWPVSEEEDYDLFI